MAHHPTTDERASIPMPEGIDMHNGGHARCDMADGPCACGAWHHLTDWPPEVRAAIDAAIPSS